MGGSQAGFPSSTKEGGRARVSREGDWYVKKKQKTQNGQVRKGAKVPPHAAPDECGMVAKNQEGRI